MKLKMYAVRDSKIEHYASPFFVPHRGQALRSWQETANDAQTSISRHPNDYCLFEIGEFDSETAAFVPHPQPVSLGLASEFVKAGA